MKRIGISAAGDQLSSKVKKHFGRSDYFCIVEGDAKQVTLYKVLDNQGTQHPGRYISDMLAKENIEAVVTGSIGHGAMNNLNQNGIDVYQIDKNGTVEELAKKYFDGNLQQLNSPNLVGKCSGPRCGSGKGKNRP